MRRLAAALEGLRDRLERPAFNPDALRWRLHGPVGPLALARQVSEEEGEGAAFMIAEVAMTVYRADWSAAERTLGPGPVRQEVATLLADLRALARAKPAPANLSGYVRACFEEFDT
jgi:hypothetical protein